MSEIRQSTATLVFQCADFQDLRDEGFLFSVSCFVQVSRLMALSVWGHTFFLGVLLFVASFCFIG